MLSTLRRHALAVATAIALSIAALYVSTQASRAQSSDAPPATAAPAGDKIPPVIVETPKQPQQAPAAAPAQKPAESVVEDAPPAPPKKKPAKQAAKPKPKPQVSAVPADEPAPAPASEPPSRSPAAALGSYNPALDLPPNFEFPPGTTLTTAGPVQGYRALSSMSSTKTATPIEEIPQSIQVVPRSVITDQQSVTMTEALQNVSNVQGPTILTLGNTDLQPVTVRGFGAEQWIDGLPVVYNAGDRDSFVNVERVEVLKGPSAILYGGGSGAPIGGAVNIVSKLPTDKASGEAGLKFGSFGFVQPYFDINQPISPNVLFRLTGEYTASDSFVDVIETDRYSINPTLTLTNRTDTTLTIQGRISKVEQQTYQGLPVTGTLIGNFDIERDLFIGPSDIERGHSEAKSVTVTFDHKFNEIFSANLKARYGESSFEQNVQLLQPSGFPVLPAFLPSTFGLANAELYQEQDEFTINPNLQARFNLGESRHTLLLGADYSKIHDSGFLNLDALGFAATVDLANPNPSFPIPYSDPSGPFAPLLGGFTPFSDAKYTLETKGLYAQLQSTFFDRVHVLAGLRKAEIKIDYLEKINYTPLFTLGPAEEFETNEDKVLPRVGAVVDVWNGLSVFASYSEGMRGVPSSQGIDGEPKAEFSVQREAGIRFNIMNQLSGTLSVFEIERDNVLVTVGLGQQAFANQGSEGFEADLIWQPTQNFQLLANYGYVKAEFRDAFQNVPKGNRFSLVPEETARVWANYKFDAPLLKGLSVGAGVFWSAGAFVDDENLYKTEDYFTVDAKVAYETENFVASFNVKNLTDEEYFVPYAWFGSEVAPGEERAYYGSVALKY